MIQASSRDRVPRLLAGLRNALSELYGERMVELILFGSRARGDADPDSDIDVLVVLEGPVEPGREIDRTSSIITGMSLEHDVVISRAFVSADRYRSEQSPFLMNVRREEVAI